MSDYISHDHEHDGIDRRGFLHCMAWAGTGLLWTISGGVLASRTLAEIAKAGGSLPAATDLSFLQISDSHIGFSKEANKDVTETFKIALDRINAMPTPPSFLIHTGDITQLSKPEEFDTFDEVLKSCRTKDVFYVPGEHDVLNDGGKLYRERYLKSVEAKGAGWYSFNKNGVHFIGLWIPKTFRLGDCAQRPHPPSASEGRRERDVPYCDVYCVSPARTWNGAITGSHESAGRTAAQPARPNKRRLQARQNGPCGRRLQPQLDPFKL